MQQRRAVLLAILAVSLGLLLIDAHGSPRQAASDLREVVSDLRDQVQHREDQ